MVNISKNCVRNVKTPKELRVVKGEEDFIVILGQKIKGAV